MVDVAPPPTSFSKEALDKLFASSDDEDAGPSILPDIDRAQVARDAQRKARESLNLPAAGGSAPPPEATQGTPNGPDPVGAKRKRDEDEEEGPKRRVMAKIDAERLLGEYGFPALVQQTKNFKPKGKGHEKDDLDRVMTLYQLWAHRMFPKRRFIDTVERVEKVCREKRMLVALSVWRDALNPNAPQNKEPVSEADIILSDDEAGPKPSSGEVDNNTGQPGAAADARDRADDEDDEEIWAEILSRMKSNTVGSTQPNTTGASAVVGTVEKEKDDLFADDEDAIWDEMMRDEEAQGAEKTQRTKNTPAQAEDEDALWDEMMREEEEAATTRPAAVTAEEDEEDMMVLMRETEEAADVVAPTEKPSEPAAPLQETNTAPVPTASTDEDDWERLYD
ncbi:Swi3-domain-containing protein [Calocera viscosa TUFC12733]|uniref:Chromosome segregation in meiosis protein n=1 Tax=Calocera viscosa (strain TUFC12733) TaxID=1330018 RepID=A0A167LME6_CALVF|nr:Swi3-domain-containing protein [Calocera viscosa TUFC12733]